MDLYISCKIEKFLTNEKGTLLVLDTGQTKFLISGMLTTETEEIECAILTSKLEEAKPEGKEEAIKKYSKAFKMKNGTLPWVTDSTYQVLLQQFKSKE